MRYANHSGDKSLINVPLNEDEYAKGLNKLTYKMIWMEIEKNHEEEFTAEELSEKLGIARVTV